MAHQNEELLRKGYAAFAAGDLDTVTELLADDIVWHVPGDTMISGDYEGKQAVLEFLVRTVQETGGTFRQEIHDVLANDEHGAVLVEVTAERGGKTVQARDAHVMHLEDGQLKEFWTHPGDQTAWDEFWS